MRKQPVRASAATARLGTATASLSRLSKIGSLKPKPSRPNGFGFGSVWLGCGLSCGLSPKVDCCFAQHGLEPPSSFSCAQCAHSVGIQSTELGEHSFTYTNFFIKQLLNNRSPPQQTIGSTLHNKQYRYCSVQDMTKCLMHE